MSHACRILHVMFLVALLCPGSSAQSNGAPEAPRTADQPDAFMESIPQALEVSQPVTDFVERMLGAVRTGDPVAFAACFDTDELIDRGFQILQDECGALERVGLENNTVGPTVEQLRAELERRLGSRGGQPRMEKRFEDGTIYFVLATRSDTDLRDRYIHFCLRGTDQLLATDFEYEDTAIWASELVAYTSRAAGAPGELGRRLVAYGDAFLGAHRLHEEGRSSEALAALEELEGDATALGLQVPVTYWRTVMEIAFESGFPGLADHAAQQLIKLRPATPLPRFFRGRIALDRGEAEAARVHLANYQRLVGPDGQSLSMMGDSYEQSDLLGDALGYWRVALDQNPDLTDALYSLGMHLEGDATQELVERFLAVQDPLRHFEPLVSAWRIRERCDAVAVLSAARRETEPRDGNAYYYEAACELKRSNFARVRELALAGREQVPEQDRRPYDALWLEAAWSMGDPLDAYREAPDKGFAFDTIAEQLTFGAGDLQQLLELIELRRVDDPQDIWIPYYQGQAYHAQGQYVDADDQFRIGYTHALEAEDADRAAAYRLARTDNAYAGGSGIAAYQQMPEDDVYRRLLELVLSARDGDTLAQLVALRRELHPDDAQLGFWVAHAMIISGQEETGLERLMARRGEFVNDPVLAPWLESDLVRANVRLKRYDQALEFAEASTKRDGNPFYEFVVQVARGNATAAETLYEQLRDRGYGPDRIYADQDIGELLRKGEPFARFRALWPPPAKASR